MNLQITLNVLLPKWLCPILMPGLCGLALCGRADVTTNPATEWIDPDTGHRVVQLSTEPGSESLYFNLNPFTPDGKKMIITTPKGISMINLQTRDIEKIVEGRVHIIMVGRKTGTAFITSAAKSKMARRTVLSARLIRTPRRFAKS